jgi:membrane-associated phospholipid phosphatase
MKSISDQEHPPVQPPVPPTLVGQLARWISNIAHPILTSLSGVVVIAIAMGTPEAWKWAVIGLLITVGVPSLYLVWLVRSGRATDFDVFVRQQRKGPYLVTIACLLLCWVVMYFGAAPLSFVVILSASILEILLLFLINLRWKISAHATTSAGFAVLIWQLFGPPGALWFLFSLVVIWSRVYLKRHTLAQTLFGALLGAALIYLAFQWFLV